MVKKGSVGRPRARAGGFKAVSRAVVGRMGGHAGLVGSLRTGFDYQHCLDSFLLPH